MKNTKVMCDKGGFNLHKFVSNSKEVLKEIPESDGADRIRDIDLDLDSLPLERTHRVVILSCYLEDNVSCCMVKYKINLFRVI